MVTSHASSIDTGCSCPVSSHCPVSMIAPGILALHLVSPHCTGYHCIRYSCLHDHDHRYRVQLSGIQSWIARAAASPSNFDVPNPVASSARKPPFRKHLRPQVNFGANHTQLWRNHPHLWPRVNESYATALDPKASRLAHASNLGHSAEYQFSVGLGAGQPGQAVRLVRRASRWQESDGLPGVMMAKAGDRVLRRDELRETAQSHRERERERESERERERERLGERERETRRERERENPFQIYKAPSRK